MAKDSWTQNNPVAELIVLQRLDVDSNFQPMNETLSICADDDFYIGRNSSLCYYSIQGDCHISNQHLRVHCILFDENSVTQIPPLVYAHDCSANGTFISHTSPDVDVLAIEKATQERRICPRNRFVLLRDGDRLRIGPFVALEFHYLEPYNCSQRSQLTHRQLLEIRLFKDRYSIADRILGKGGHAVVYFALHRKSNRQLACKIHNRQQLSPESICHSQDQLRIATHRFREFDILKDLDHAPKYHQTGESVLEYIFQDLIPGGDLFSYLQHMGGRLSDGHAALVLLQILKAVEYLHDLGIVHRDLKLENILMTSLDHVARVILTDFETARRVPTCIAEQSEIPCIPNRMLTCLGTAEYSAPEVHRLNATMSPSEGYSKAVDMWSIGVIAAMLVSGESIFANHIRRDRPDFDLQVLRAAAKCDLSELEWASVWHSVGNRPKDLIKNLLVLDESARLTAKGALQHAWFTASGYCTELDQLYLEAIKGWRPHPKVFRLVEQLDVERLQPNGTTQSSRLSITDAQNSTYFDLSNSPARRVLPSGKVTTKQLSTLLPPIEEETTAEVLSASIQYPAPTLSEYESQNEASIDELCTGDYDRCADLNVEVEMTDDSQASQAVDDNTQDGSRMDYENNHIVSESPVTQDIKRRLPFEEEDFTVDEIPIAVHTRINLPAASKGNKERHSSAV